MRAIFLGPTIASRCDTRPPESASLVARYSPNDRCISKGHMPSISIIPRRAARLHRPGYTSRYHQPSDVVHHCPGPLLRPSHHSLRSRTCGPGPAAYPMYEYDEDIFPRPHPGFTQKSRHTYNSTTTSSRPSPPFYYPEKLDRHRLPSFSIGKRALSSTGTNTCSPPYYTPLASRALCTSVIQPGATLKGRRSSAAYTK